MKNKLSKKPKGLINGAVQGINQILPFHYPWAWDLYIRSSKNHWLPSEIPMNIDIEQWKKDDVLSSDEKHVVKRLLGFFAGAESIVSNNLLLIFNKWITNPECRQWILRQALEEGIHNHSLVYICESLNLDELELYEAYINIPSVKSKDDFLIGITTDMTRSDFNTKSKEGKQELLRNAITYWLICEGIFFFNGFATLLSFKRQNKLKGIGEMIEYTQRDEENHIEFGTKFINELIKENPEIWTEKFKKETYEHFKKAVELEASFGEDILPNGILGLNKQMFNEYAEYLGNIRLAGIGLDQIFTNKKNPFTWLFETIQGDKLKNFFESRVTEYQSGGVVDDF